MNSEKRQKISNTQKITSSKIYLFDWIPDEILSIIALFFDENSWHFCQSYGTIDDWIFFSSRRAFLQTCKRFHRIGQEVFNPCVKKHSPIAQLAALGDLNGVQQLLQKKCVHDKKNLRTAYLSACSTGRFHIVQALLADPRFTSGVDAFQIDLYEGLLIASEGDYINVVKLLLENPHTELFGDHPIEQQWEPIIKTLLKHLQ